MHSKTPGYQRHRFPTEIIRHGKWLYYRICLRFREVEELLVGGCYIASYETLRQWCQKFFPAYAGKLMEWQDRSGDTWQLDNMCNVIQRPPHYLRRAVDQDGKRIAMLVQLRRMQIQTVYYRRLGSQAFRVWKEWVCA